jgi:hypothetical protein
MKYILFCFSLLISLAAFGQSPNREIVSDTAFVQWRTSPDTAWFYVRNITYSDGGFVSEGLRVGDTLAMRTYLINQVVDVQRLYADAIRVVANSGNTNAALNRYSAMMMTVTGRTYFVEIAALLGDGLLGRYSVAVTGQTTFQADLIRLPSGVLRFRRVDNADTQYTVNLLSDKSFRVIGLPGATAAQDVAFWQLNNLGRRVFSNTTRTVRITRIDGAANIQSNNR